MVFLSALEISLAIVVASAVSVLSHYAGKCAEARGRKYGLSLLASFLFTPFIILFVLLCLGDTNERRKEKILEEESWRMDLWNKK